jgi:NADPH2:quinone reductase
MRAAWYEQKGTAPELIVAGEMADPTPGPGEVRVRLAFAGVNPSDFKHRDPARNGSKMEHPRIVPGMDGAGTVDATGPGTALRTGMRVWVYEAQHGRASGTYAQFVVLPEQHAVPLPDAISFEEGACLGIPAMTAHRSLFADGPIRGKNVLVAGASGAVGFYALQLARWAGAYVIGTVRSEEKARFLREAGFDAIVNTREGDAAQAIRALAPAGIDRVIEVDVSENFELDRAVLAQDGVISTYSPAKDRGAPPPPGFYSLMRLNAALEFVYLYSVSDEAKGAAIRDITACLEQGVLHHNLALRHFSLSEAGTAQIAVERGTLGGRALIDLA